MLFSHLSSASGTGMYTAPELCNVLGLSFISRDEQLCVVPEAPAAVKHWLMLPASEATHPIDACVLCFQGSRLGAAHQRLALPAFTAAVHEGFHTLSCFR